jgi:hypothetical protein
LPPPSGAMKPKPLEVLKNFTVPMVIKQFLLVDAVRRMPHGRGLYGVAGKVVHVVQARTS